MATTVVGLPVGRGQDEDDPLPEEFREMESTQQLKFSIEIMRQGWIEGSLWPFVLSETTNEVQILWDDVQNPVDSVDHSTWRGIFETALGSQ